MNGFYYKIAEPKKLYLGNSYTYMYRSKFNYINILLFKS